MDGDTVLYNNLLRVLRGMVLSKMIVVRYVGEHEERVPFLVEHVFIRTRASRFVENGSTETDIVLTSRIILHLVRCTYTMNLLL